VAAEQWGVVSLPQLRGCGLNKQNVANRVTAGRLHPIHRGVYAVGHTSLRMESHFIAAVLACGPRAVLSHHSAAALYGYLPWDPDRRVEVTVLGATARRHPEVRVHRTNRLPIDDATREQGIRITSPARTLLDLAAVLPRRALRRAVRQAMALRRVNVRFLIEVLARHPHRRGRARLARIVAAGPAPTRSELEDLVLDLIASGGLATPDVNVAMIVSGRRLVPDFRWPARRLIVEADGAAWHEHKLAREDDAERQALLEAHGERVIRVTWDQALLRPAQTLHRLRAAGAPAHDTAPVAAAA
jgi:hypothetical protein